MIEASGKGLSGRRKAYLKKRENEKETKKIGTEERKNEYTKEVSVNWLSGRKEANSKRKENEKEMIEGPSKIPTKNWKLKLNKHFLIK